MPSYASLKASWSDCFASHARVARKNDVGFIDTLIAHAIASHHVAPDRVYLIEKFGPLDGDEFPFYIQADFTHLGTRPLFWSVAEKVPPGLTLHRTPYPKALYAGAAYAIPEKSRAGS